ncbi:hypothetical protein [Cellulomonas iranensis]|uniref:hypothetical protein n=1 Tax=Cellulomonas iranensis TaxID=76862 RepID=UPI003D7E93B4
MATGDDLTTPPGTPTDGVALAASARQATTYRSRNLGMLILLAAIGVGAFAVAALAFRGPTGGPGAGWFMLAVGVLFLLFVVLRGRRVATAAGETTRPPFVTAGPSGLRTRDGVELAWEELSRVIVVLRAKKQADSHARGNTQVGQQVAAAAQNAEGLTGRIELEARDAALLRSRLAATGSPAATLKGAKLVLPFRLVAEDAYPAFSQTLHRYGQAHGVGVVERSESY